MWRRIFFLRKEPSNGIGAEDGWCDPVSNSTFTFAFVFFTTQDGHIRPSESFLGASSTNHSTVTLACVGTQETKGWQYEPHSAAGCALWVNCV